MLITLEIARKELENVTSGSAYTLRLQAWRDALIKGVDQDTNNPSQ